MVTENSEGVGISKAKIFKVKCEAKLEFPAWEGGWGSNYNTFLGGAMDSFWNNTLMHNLLKLTLSISSSQLVLMSTFIGISGNASKTFSSNGI